MIIGSTIFCVFNECPKRSGAEGIMLGNIGLCRYVQIWGVSKCTEDIGKHFKALPLKVYEGQREQALYTMGYTLYLLR